MGGGVAAVVLATVLILLSPVTHTEDTSGHVASPLQTSALLNIETQIVRRTSKEKKTIQEELDKAVVADKLREKWNNLISGRPKAVSETTVGNAKEKHVKFERVGRLSLKEAFHYMQYYPLLYPEETKPTTFEIPIGRDYQNFKLKNKKDGTFELSTEHTSTGGVKTKVDLSNIDTTVAALTDSKLKLTTRNTLQQVSIEALDAKLNRQPDFHNELTAKDKTISATEKNEAVRATTDFLVASTVLRKDLKGLKPATWLQTVKTDIDTRMGNIQEGLSQEIAAEGTTKLQYEITQSMLKSKSQAIKEWDHIKSLKTAPRSKTSIIEEQIVGQGKKQHLKVTVHETDKLSLKDTFKLLQFYPDIYDSQGSKHTRFEVPIGGETRKFRLSKSGGRAKNQIFVTTDDKDWPGTTKRGKGKSGVIWGPDYNTMVDNVLKKFPDHSKLVGAMVDATDHKLVNQPDFSNDLNIPRKPKNTADTARATVEFMAVSMIAEAAQPTDESKTTFLKDLAKKIREEKRFPPADKMPSLAKLKGKSGRSPAMDEYVEGKLEDVRAGAYKIDDAFSTNEFPVRRRGGTNIGRTLMYQKGGEMIPSYLIRKRAAGDHDGEVIAKKVARYCTGTRRRRKRSACSLKDRKSVDENSIKVNNEKVEFDMVDRRDAAQREHVVLQVSANELATPKLIEDHMVKSRRAGATKVYTTVNKGLAVHGLIFSALGAIDYFSKGDNVHGGVSLTMSAHTLGGITGVNEMVNKVGKQVLRSAAKGVAKGLNLERGLETFSTKVEQYMEKGVGKMLGDIPLVGLAFDIYFIKEDIDQLANLDLNDPQQVKLLPLRVLDLALDIDTTVLNLVGTFCPEAEVVTEPLIIILSVIRMAIDDFYIDIMEEMDKVNWNSPWAGLEFIGALVKGIVDGAADFFTGGLRRQMESLQKKQDADKKLLQNLKNPSNYYKIVGEKEGDIKKIDFTQGMLSNYGGYINFRLLDNDRAMLEIGDVSGSGKTIQKTFNVDPNLKNIVLGLGESRSFKYKQKNAKLWFVIPIKKYKIICGAKMHKESVFGTYYGNSRNNKFYAVQKPDPKAAQKIKDSDCNHGKLNLKFLLGNYHYNLYGRGGDDTFYLGPQLSSVTGGEGSDVYVIESDGGATEIDNFAEDKSRDIVVINVNYDNIKCIQNEEDLDVTYSKIHHITIKKWFTPGDVKYYQHMSFRSNDGVMFVPKQTSIGNDGNSVECVAVALDLSSAKSGQAISINIPKYRQVKQVSGSSSADTISGNDANNILDGSGGPDHLTGGKNEDTYIIRANEGCDTIDNEADDYLKTTDVLVFDVPFDKINPETTGNDLSVTDVDNPTKSCFTVAKWTVGDRFRHMLFTSSDHVVFKILTSSNGVVSKVPIMLDYKNSKKGVCVHLADSPKPRPDCIKPSGYSNVATVSDSPHDDSVIGNAQSNFLSCSGGNDFLKGGEGSDNYIVKKECKEATVDNDDSRRKADLLFIEETFNNLQINKENTDLKIFSNLNTPKVVLKKWFESNNYRHLGLRTKDGITSRIHTTTGKLVPTEVSKDPTECQCRNANCQRKEITYDLKQNPWKRIVRFQLKSSHCSYKIYGNNLNNYLDPGAGNGYNYQHLEGRNGSDTYVLNHGYGEFNEINNYATDNKQDTLQLGLEFDDIRVYFHGADDVILASNVRPSSLSVQILSYFSNRNYQHLQIITTDKIVFEIIQQHPFKRVISVDRTNVDSPQKISPNKKKIIASAQDIKGSLSSANNLTGSATTRMIEGGAQADILRGGPAGTSFEGKEGKDKIYGGVGSDVIFGGDGDDLISAGPGDDYIYGGNGQDVIDGGEGSDTVSFRGDGFLHQGVTVDLSIGFGNGVDAEGDKYQNIENVYGTIHNDFLIGSDSNNKLYGLEGDDTLVANGGDDKLVGGKGRDLYILYKSSGLKVIDNYAEDEIEDTLSLVHLMSTEVCVFLVGNDLHLQMDNSNLASVLFYAQPLTVIISNWKVSTKYQHIKVAFKDRLWQGSALSSITSSFEDMERPVKEITKHSQLLVASKSPTSVTLTWNTKLNNPSLLKEADLFVISFKRKNPNRVNKIKVNGRSLLVISPEDPKAHMVFGLEMKKCSTTIAVSHTLTTFGRERACSAIQVPHAIAWYLPFSAISSVNKVHGATGTVKCDEGYSYRKKKRKLTATCLDRKWIPSLPTCKKVKICQAPRKPAHGEVSATGFSEGSKAHFTCHKGYRLRGRRERECVGEVWTGKNPVCRSMDCPQLPQVSYGRYAPCHYMKYAKTYGTFNNPLEGYCVKLQCNIFYLPSHKFYQKKHPSRWESNWKIPQGGRVCSDGRWVGYVEDKCELTARLTSVNEQWNMISGTLELWQNGVWTIASSAPTDTRLQRSCRSVRLNRNQYLSYSLNRRGQVLVTCSKLRLTDPKPTEYEGKVEVFNKGVWEGICVTASGSAETCRGLGFNYDSTVVNSQPEWTEHVLTCPP